MIKWQTIEARRPTKKMKPNLVYEYLMRNFDENNVVKTEDIIDYLRSCEISAERRSIYKDIDEINKAILIAEGVAVDISVYLLTVQAEYSPTANIPTLSA